MTKAIDYCRASEVSKSQVKSLTEEEKSAHVQIVKKKQHSGTPRQGMQRSSGKKTTPSRHQPAQPTPCQRCGYKHATGQCPAQGQICKKCKLKNHFARMCLTTNPVNQFNRSRYQNKVGSKQVNVLHEPDSDSDCESPLFIGSMGKEQGQEYINSDWYAHMLIKNHEVTLKLDTGAQCNVLPYYLFKEIGGNKIVNSSVKKLVTFTGEKIRTVGKAMLECEYKDKFHVLEFQVEDHNVIPVLGLQTCQDLNMIQKVECIVDDILVWGETIEQHNQRLRNVLERVKQSGIKLNRSKCQIGVTEIKYIGHTLSDEGLKPDLEKVEAITNMPDPEDKAGLQRFMGMLQYVSKFIPNLSTESAPLRQLLEKNVIWNWNEMHRNCYKRLKELVSSAPVLRFYDVNESVTLSVDASSTGLGAVILQNDQPVAFASKALTETQMRYAQIEKEMLAIVFGCVKFHQYIFGKTITVQTDHKPLESIMKKPLYLAPIRLQKMLMKLQRYDLKVEYTKGTELYVADTLSRAHLPETSDDFDEELEVSIVLAVSDTKMSQIGRETGKDETLKILKSVILEGWPENRSQLHTKVQDFWSYRDELSVYDDIIYKGERIVIPSSMRSEMLDRIHESHLGIEKSRSRARDILFWPRMSQDIEELISKCSVCQEHRNKNQKEPLLPHEVPNRPWSKLGADIFQFGNEQYLLIVDYYSEFFEISKLSDLKSITVITHCKLEQVSRGSRIPPASVTALYIK